MHTPARLYHHHTRKRPKKGTRFDRLLDNSVCVVAAISPIMTIPQIIKIWTIKDAESLSLPTWGTYALMNVFWLIYGIRHRNPPLLINSLLWAVLYVIILAGIFLYG